MIAGPNGSGKSTLAAQLRQCGLDLGEWLNADEIALAEVERNTASRANLAPSDREAELRRLWEFESRRAQELVRQRRNTAMQRRVNFAFETVMSHPSHIEFLQSAREAGFRTRLFFVCTSTANINVGRVANRVLHGGHDVPIDRIKQRYFRCLNLLPEAIRAADEAMIYDNSDINRPLRLLALVKDGFLRHGQILPSRNTADVDHRDVPGWWKQTLFKIRPIDLFFDGPIS